MMKYNFVRGFLLRKKLYFIFAAICTLQMFLTVQIDDQKNLFNILFCFFRGVEPYVPSPDNKFIVPIIWMIFHLSIAYISGDFLYKELCVFGQYTIIKSKSRKKWWYQKCLWIIANCIIIYLIVYIVAVLFNIIKTGKFYISSDNFLGSKYYITFVIVIVPILSSIVLSLIQFVLLIVVGETTSFLIIVSFLLTCVYLNKNYMFCNSTMMIRNSICVNNGLNSKTIFIICLGIGFVAVALGNLIFNRYDILFRKRGIDL